MEYGKFRILYEPKFLMINYRFKIYYYTNKVK